MAKIAKGIVFFGFLLIILGIVLCTKDTVIIYVDKYFSPEKYVKLENTNEYYRDVDFEFVQNTEFFVPTIRQDILNIYYTVINSGTNSFTFYCTNEYPNCTRDVQNIANDQELLSDINNYVHPYNGFAHIETEFDSVGRVTINIVHNYTPEEIAEINQKVDDLSLQLINKNDSTYNNIRRIHDYIINHSKYDIARAEHNDTTYKSDNAYGPLFQGMAVCGGYTDLMQLFLEKMDIPNYRVSSDKHVWNAVYINNSWQHLDLTWDDPVYDDGHQVLDHSFFLVSTNKLLELEQTQHSFDESHYLELKRA